MDDRYKWGEVDRYKRGGIDRYTLIVTKHMNDKMKCEECGVEMEVRVGGGRVSKYCSGGCRVKAHRRAWKEGGKPAETVMASVGVMEVKPGVKWDGDGKDLVDGVAVSVGPGVEEVRRGMIVRDPEAVVREVNGVGARVGSARVEASSMVVDEEPFDVPEEVRVQEREDVERMGSWEAGRVNVIVTEMWITSHLSVGWEHRMAKRKAMNDKRTGKA